MIFTEFFDKKHKLSLLCSPIGSSKNRPLLGMFGHNLEIL